MASGSPDIDSRSIAGPPGYPRPRKRATLSNASPAASSRVWPSRRYRPWPSMHTSIVWPPDTSSTTSGNVSSGSSRNAAYRCASRWLTDTNGTSQVSASAFAAETPTSSAPISPGPVVAATASMRLPLEPRLDERTRRHRDDELVVRPTGDLGHHAAVPRVQVHLGRHHRGHHVGATADAGGGGLVARGLDAEHHRVRAGERDGSGRTIGGSGHGRSVGLTSAALTSLMSSPRSGAAPGARRRAPPGAPSRPRCPTRVPT